MDGWLARNYNLNLYKSTFYFLIKKYMLFCINNHLTKISYMKGFRMSRCLTYVYEYDRVHTYNDYYICTRVQIVFILLLYQMIKQNKN